jgi:HEAT repeat protein
MVRAVSAVAAAVLLLGGPAWGSSGPTFEELLANLKSPNAKTRRKAAEELGKSRRREAVMPLAALVRDPEPKVRLEVVRALRDLRDQDAVPAMVTSLGDGDPTVRLEAVAGLVEMYADIERQTPVGRFLDIFSDEYESALISPLVQVDPAVHEGLGNVLMDEDEQIRREAAKGLGVLDGRSEMDRLRVALDDPAASVRAAAVTAVGKIGSAEDGEALIPLLADDSSDVRNRVLHALGQLQVQAAGSALRRMYESSRHPETRLRILSCLSRVKDPDQADLFRELVQAPNSETHRLAVEGLGRIAGEEMLPAFKKDFQREGNDELRLAYAFSLTYMGDKAFVDTIVLSLPSRTLGRRCEEYLLEMGDEILSELYAYLYDPDADIRAAICEILRQIGDPEAIHHLTPLIHDSSSRVSDQANRAVEYLKRVRAATGGR